MSTPDSKDREALVFLNLGTPESYAPRDVGRYLREFLMDPYVIDMPAMARWLLVNALIIPVRVRRSARAYQKIWSSEGSPLKHYSQKLVDRVQQKVGRNVSVKLAMRYGSPSIESVATQLVKEGFKRVHLFPAYPQYATSSTFTGLVAFRRALDRTGFRGEFSYLESYETDARFIKAWSTILHREFEAFHPDHILFSFHGLPLSHLQTLNPGCKAADCCDVYGPEKRLCYRRQCFATARELARILSLPQHRYSVSFQSRLSDRWIKPYSDEFYRTLPSRGVSKLLVACPSFTIDCLETLEEVGMRAAEQFQSHGGVELRLAPALNDSETFVEAVAEMFNDDRIWKRDKFAGAGEGEK